MYAVSCRKENETPKRSGTYVLRLDDAVVADTDAGEQQSRERGRPSLRPWRDEQRAQEEAIARRLLDLGPVVLYVHGFNTKPDEPVATTAVLQQHLNRNHVQATVVPFIWPSAGHLADYFPDQRAAGHYGSYALVNLLLSLNRAAAADAPPVHCIAHSMGTYVVTRALSTIATLHLDLASPLRQVAFMQPDIDFDVLCSGYADTSYDSRVRYDSQSYLEIPDGYGATEMVERLTIYCSTNDVALFASLSRTAPNAWGHTGPGLEGVGDAATIMQTKVRRNVFVVNCDDWEVFDPIPSHSHSHFLDCPRMMTDVAATLAGQAAEATPGRDSIAPRWYRLNATTFGPGVLRLMAGFWRAVERLSAN